MDITAIQAAVASLKTATEVSRSILEMKSMSEVQDKVTELQSALLEAQNCALTATASQFELQNKIRELENRLSEKENWHNQAVRYQLVSPWRGPAQAYALKMSHSHGEVPHLVCSSCFHQEQKVILNPVKNKEGFVQMVCPSCKSTMDTGFRGIGSPKYAEEYGK